VSLILDALRKIEREKQAPRRGFVVMTHVPWSQGTSRTRLLVGAVLALSVAVAVLGVALWRRGAAQNPIAATTPSATPVAVATPLPVAIPTPSSPEAPATAAAVLEAAPVPPPARRARTARPTPVAVAAASPPPPVANTPAPAPPRPALAKGEVRLNAISRQSGQPVAVVNDRLVREGDVFDGIRVIRIREATVEVEVDGQRRTVGF
jgi:hypothetical protein